ncbi:transcription elongation factor 1 homolog isoform 1-T3 [Lycaon pictus]
MGRRKSKRKPPPKKKMTGTLETQFTCPFCNHEKSCDVKMDRARNTGVISCTVCLEEFQTPITSCVLTFWTRPRPAEAASGLSSLLTHLTSTLPI